MTDAVLSLLVENLWQLVSENVNLIRGAENELKNLLAEVNTLKAFLADAALLDSNSNLWKDLVNKIRMQARKAEETIDKFKVEAKLREEKNLFKRVFDFRHVNRVKNLAQDIDNIRKNVNSIRQNNQQVLQPTPRLNLPKTAARDPQDTFVEVRRIVGFDEKANEVIPRLVGGTMDVECIPIVGMVGSGKTTLATKICSDSQITSKFSKNIWVSVGQSNELKHVFFVILKSSTEPIQELRFNGKNELAKVIPNFVTEQHRCLIVLDDVWARELVDFFKNVLPDNKKGHRILMTTHFRDVATYASEKPYYLKFLNPEESFQLLENRVFDYGRCRDELEELGKSIASKCRGLPLALVVIAGALRVSLTVHDWEKMEKYLWQNLVKENDTTTCWKIVEASYGSLSSDMKVCFLYCLAFPKGYDIPAQMLIRLWIAEDLIKSCPQNSFEEIAESYLIEFEKRDLVIVSRDTTGSIKRVKCVDIFYDLYKIEVSKESVFLQLGLTPDLPSINDPDISHRLHIESSNMSDFMSSLGRPSAEHVRSFLCFSSEDDDQQNKLSSHVDIQRIPKAFPLLRVLKIEPINISSLKNLDQLYHLRYISISGDFKELPSFFSKFWSLQSIIINNTNTLEPTFNIKANIWNMPKLTHFQTNKPAKLPLPCSTQKGKGFSSLQTLSKISPETCNKVMLGEARKTLKKLSIQGRIEDSLRSNRDKFSTFEGFQTFENFKCLENLKLISDVPCTSDALQLPKALFRFLRKLRKLTLSNTMFDWKDANKLGQLECLEVLKLKIDAFTGKSWKTEEDGFQQLQVLLIHSVELQFWKASRCHFPGLRKLELECPQLKIVPTELKQFLAHREVQREV